MKQSKIIWIVFLSCWCIRLLATQEYSISSRFYFSEIFYDEMLHDPQGDLVAIESYRSDCDNFKQLIQREQFFWGEGSNGIKFQLNAKILEDSEKNELCCHFFEYDEESRLVKVIVDNRNYEREPVCTQDYKHLEIFIFYGTEESTINLPEVLEERAFDSESNQLLLIKRIVNYYDQGKLQRQEVYDVENQTILENICFYDTRGMLIGCENNLGKCEEFFYDICGNKIEIDIKQNSELVGRKTYVYNKANKLVQINEVNVSGYLFIKTLNYALPYEKNEISEENPSQPLYVRDAIAPSACNKSKENQISTLESPAVEDMLPSSLDPPPSDTSWSFCSMLENTLYSVEKVCCRVVSQTASYLGKMKEGLSYGNYISKEWDEALHLLFGSSFLKLAGYYQYEADSGSFGYGGEIHDKVRITLINGILNVRDDLHYNTHQLSDTHGGTVIHYVFRPTQGWASDLINCCLVKFGYVSPQAYLLAEKWKELIQDMGGIEGGGKIIHYAHSIGGTDTYAAKNLLRPEEQKMIQVITIGSPTLIPNEGFANVTNYVSKRDGVCMLDPIGLFSGWWEEKSHVVFLGSFWGVPLVEHTLDTKSYGEIISLLGERFINAYETPEKA